MSEGPEKERPDGGGTNPDESMLTEQENRAQPIEHKANVEATRERQLLEAIGAIDPTNGKKDQKAQNPLNKNKESRQDSNTTLGAKAANTKITKPGTQRQMKSNSNQLASASKEDWYGTTNIEESLIIESAYKPPNPQNANEGNILAAILANTLATNSRLDILQLEVQKLQEQNPHLQAGLHHANNLIEELKNKGKKSQQEEISDPRNTTQPRLMTPHKVADPRWNDWNFIDGSGTPSGFMHSIHTPPKENNCQGQKENYSPKHNAEKSTPGQQPAKPLQQHKSINTINHMGRPLQIQGL
ncbi:hypothetical protein FPQ18DRAFT_385298 [Pyronema domesticum]|nr:hypothetical protein FPQ18DRAFT_385298 [Pyronema domesticum]